MGIYMKLPTADGEVTEKKHDKWIELLACNWSMSRTLRSAVGVGSNRESSSPYVSELSVTKYIDSASKGVANLAFVGAAKEVTIDFTRTDKGEEATFRKLVLTDAIISSLVNDANGSDRPTESLTLNFTQIAITDTQMKSDGTAGSPSTTTYDLVTAQTK